MPAEKQEGNPEQPAVKEKYLQFQLLQQYLGQASQQMELLQEQMKELEVSQNAVEELGRAEKGKELLAPLANGIFLKAELKDNQKLIVNVGSNITVEKTRPEVVELLKKQGEEVAQRIVEVNSLIQELAAQAGELYQEIENVRQTQK